MPMQLAPADRKILTIAGIGFAIIVLASLFLARGGGADRDIPSAYSVASGGCKAAFLLLSESGYSEQTWEQPLDALPPGKGNLLILAEPVSFPSPEEKQRLEAFLREGGQIISAGQFVGFYLPFNDSAPDALNGTVWKHWAAISPSAITRAAPEITMASSGHWRHSTGAVGLYGKPDEPVVVEYKIGDGKVIWLAEPSPLTNAGLKESGNLQFLLAAVGSPGERHILWDEYVHGYSRSDSTKKSNRVLAWLGLQLAVFSVAILLAYSRRSGPVWLPQSESRLSPLEFVRTLGALYEHARAANVAVDISYQRFRYLLTRRLGISVNSSVSEIERALGEPTDFNRKEFASLLSECESCRYDAGVPASSALRMTQGLFDYAVRLKLIRPKQGEQKAWKQS